MTDDVLAFVAGRIADAAGRNSYYKNYVLQPVRRKFGPEGVEALQRLVAGGLVRAYGRGRNRQHCLTDAGIMKYKELSTSPSPSPPSGG